MTEERERRSFRTRRQSVIQTRNLSGRSHPVPLSFEALESAAIEHVSDDVAAYISTGAGRGTTMTANRAAFDDVSILPRVLRGGEQADLGVSVLGQQFPVPLMMAPVGAQGDIHPDGELATARAAASLDVPMALSTVSSHSMEDVAAELGDTPRWFQLYPSEDDQVTQSFVERAERAGFSAIVLTVDTPERGWRPSEADSGFSVYGRAATGFGNYFSDPEFRDRMDRLVRLASSFPYAMRLVRWLKVLPPVRRLVEEKAKESQRIAKKQTLTWDDVASINELTSLPVVLKGILHPDDAERAASIGVDGVVVSTHGGNHLDGAVAALDMLPAVVEAVGDEIDVLFDSGIRTGADVFKAIALGADAVLLGRPYVYGLALAGTEGVQETVGNVLAELETTMQNSGFDSIENVDTQSLASFGSGPS